GSDNSSGEIFIIGGGEIYREAIFRADRLYLTLIDDEKEADVFFPQYEDIFTKTLSSESREWNDLHYHWVDLERS
ncbi:MAG: dihydrofolate reductase, partial [Candidatus Pacebacteria bacterium]|nr:dihydrofolate reductase [Candidatus Paceibacterota bacterium]